MGQPSTMWIGESQHMILVARLIELYENLVVEMNFEVGCIKVAKLKIEYKLRSIKESDFTEKKQATLAPFLLISEVMLIEDEIISYATTNFLAATACKSMIENKKTDPKYDNLLRYRPHDWSIFYRVEQGIPSSTNRRISPKVNNSSRRSEMWFLQIIKYFDENI